MIADEFDLDRSIDRAWADFQEKLSEVISMMDDEGDLTLGVPAVEGVGSPCVRFSAIPGLSQTPGEPVIRLTAETGSPLRLASDSPDQSVQPPSAQTPPQINEATIVFTPPSAEWQIDDNGNYYIQRPEADYAYLARTAVTVLRDDLGVQHPVFLAPDHLAEVLQPSTQTEANSPKPRTLDEAVNLEPDDIVAVMPRNRDHLVELTADELEQYCGFPPVGRFNGELSFRIGSTVVFVRISKEGDVMELLAPLVYDIEGRTRAAEVINDLNCQAKFVRFSVASDRVFVDLTIFTRPFVPAHFHQALKIISAVADSLDDQLAVRLHGRTAFDESD